MLTVISHAPPLVSYLIGALSIMVGGILFVGAFVMPRPTEPSTLPSMREQAVPPPYKAKQRAHDAKPKAF
jgi:hypothetical protein